MGLLNPGDPIAQSGRSHCSISAELLLNFAGRGDFCGRRTQTDNAIIEAINGWIKEELFLDFGLATAKDVPKLLDEYVHYYNYERPAAALGYKSPVQYKTELGF